MKFGVRECCDVVLKAKAAQKVGKKIFYKGEPVIYFDTLKTSTLEGSGSTVYAQGGHGNARLMAWDGDRAVTFTMEDALISAEGIMILTGAGLIEAGDNGKVIYQHITETVDRNGVFLMKDQAIESEEAPISPAEANGMKIVIKKEPHLPDDKSDNFAYVMLVKDGEIKSEPYIVKHGTNAFKENEDKKYEITILADKNYVKPDEKVDPNTGKVDKETSKNTLAYQKDSAAFPDFDSVIVDYYTPKRTNAKQIDITAESFGGNYYLEASTLFRNEAGVDMPAEFIIPNCRIQSNFSFTMASTGDPSSFTFTMDCFPDYTKFDRSKKVLASIQIIEEGGADVDLIRHQTAHFSADESGFNN